MHFHTFDSFRARGISHVPLVWASSIAYSFVCDEMFYFGRRTDRALDH